MKPTTGQETNRTAGAIPTKHDLLQTEQTAEFQTWIEDQLDELVDRFGHFTTRNAVMVDIVSARSS